MALQNLSKAYTSVALTNYSVGYFNNAEDFIATKILPVFPVQKVSGKVFQYGKEALRIVDTNRGTYGSYNKVNLRVEQSSLYFLEDYGLYDEIFDEDIEDAEAAIDPEIDATEYLTQKLMLDMEKKVADAVTNPAVITNNVALTGADKWSALSTSDPLSDIETGRASVFDLTGKQPNTIILSWSVLYKLKIHPSIKNMFPGSTKITSQMVIDAMADVLGFDQVLVGKVKHNNNNIGSATQTMTNVWGDVAIIAYIENAPRKKSVTLGWTFARQASWTVQRAGKAQLGKEALISRLSSIVVVNMFYDQVFVNTDCAYLIYDVL